MSVTALVQPPDTQADELLDIEQAAMRLLAMHEHTARQLQQKLQKKDFEPENIDQVLVDLQARNLLSDERFAEQYLHIRTNKGYGPVRISREMHDKGVPDSILTMVMDNCETDWQELLESALQKKFGSQPVLNPSDRARRARFLEYRGFPSWMIRDALFT